MDWFRMYSEARNDAKLRSLSDAQHRVWFNLLCFANEQEQRGSISGYDEELLAVEVASGDVELLRETLDRLQRLRILSFEESFEESNISFINFKKRNYEKPSDAPEATRRRKRLQREREKQRHANVTPCHAPYTDTDTDTDTDINKDLYPEEVSLEKQLHRGGCEKTSAAAELIKAFEKDFGRPLGSTESEQISEWLEKNEPDVIREALRRAVLNGKYNFKYIDRILLSWEKANKRTLREVLEYEQAIEQQRTKQTPAEDAAKVVQISDRRREEIIRSACDYIRLQCGPDPPRAKAEEIAQGYGDEFVPAIIERLYGGRSP